jgi:hypothetical protein
MARRHLLQHLRLHRSNLRRLDEKAALGRLFL